MDLLKKNIHFLAAFSVLNEKQSLFLIRNITSSQAQVIGDIAANILAKGLRLSAESKTKLQVHKAFVRCIGDAATNLHKRANCIRKHPRATLTLIRVSADKILRVVKAA